MFTIPTLGPVGWQAKLIGIALVFLAGLWLGVTLHQWKVGADATATAEAQTAAVEGVRKQDGVLQAIADKSAEVLQNSSVPQGTQVVTKEVIRYVKTYVSNPNACKLDADWVYIHDLSTVPTGSTAAGATDGAASPAAADTVLSVVTSNNRQCLKEKEALAEWQRFWTKLQATKNGG